MRPYLAIIKDSFREAFASRVLWILLLLISFGLAALAPLGFRSEQTTEFRQGDFVNARGMARDMIQQYDSGAPSPGFRIVGKLDADARKLFADFAAAEESRNSSYFSDMRKIIEDLNGLLTVKDLYQEEDWQDVMLGTEARELLDKEPDTLQKEELARLNRLLIEAPYEEHFRPQPPKQIVITYVGAGISPPIRVSERRVRQVIEQIILPMLIGFLVGTIAVFAAILVTSPIIPHMFDPGSLSLLLSKPVFRSLMFLAKFVGGCAFILINVTYLIVGLWLIAGLRFGIWNQGLLLCVPIFLFLFAIYYSVSAFTGVVWRNAIICIVMTVLFWFACFVVGTTKGIFEQFAVETQRIVRLVQAGDTLIALDEQGATKYWNTASNEWEETFLENAFGPRGQVMGPVYDAEHQTLMAGQGGSRGLFGSGGSLLLGKESDGWMQVEGPQLPESTFALLPDPQGRLLAVTYSGVHKLSGDLETKKKLKVFFMEIPQSLGKPFQEAGPEPPLKLSSPAVAAVNLQNSHVVIYSRGTLMLLTCEDGDYELSKTVKVEVDEEEGAAVICGGSTILLALGDGRVLKFDAADLKLQNEYVPEAASQPRFAAVSPDGKWFAFVFHNGRLHLYGAAENEKPEMRLAAVKGQGDISAVLFSPENTMMVVDRAKRVSKYELGSFKRTESFAPALTAMEIAYYYAIVPIYTIFPKPGELDNTIQYVLKKEETTDIGGLQQGNLQAKRVRLRPWAPVRSSLIFVIVVLGIACIYIERQDF